MGHVRINCRGIAGGADHNSIISFCLIKRSEAVAKRLESLFDADTLRSVLCVVYQRQILKVRSSNPDGHMNNFSVG